jgi:hypothetical protein
MIHISFNPANLREPLKTEWEALMIKAQQATDRVIEAWERWRSLGSPGNFDYELEEEVWGALKKWLLTNVFHNKCAYCETREVRSPYHAEHFRPKGRVRFRVEGEKRLQIGTAQDEEGKQSEHPGYFWLAYHWANLLPACNYCNSALGKNDQFPIKNTHISVKRLATTEVGKLRRQQIRSPKRDGVYYLQPEDLDELEQPLLLNPYIDDPAEHIVFGDCGIIAAREGSEKGKYSISVYNLDAEDLRIARQSAQLIAANAYWDEFKRGESKTIGERINMAKAAINSYLYGEKPYSAAVLDYLRIVFPTHHL